MEKIKYYYSSMSKQVFLILVALFILLRFILLVQVVTYDINDYGNMFNMGATFFLYLFYVSICGFFFMAYKLFITEFNGSEVIYTNKILRRKRTVTLDKIHRAHLKKRGIALYEFGQDKPCFYLPFFRFGIISPVGVDNFYKVLKQNNVEIQKDFDVLPGHGKRWKWVGVLYTCLALLVLAPTTQALALVVTIFKSL